MEPRNLKQLSHRQKGSPQRLGFMALNRSYGRPTDPRSHLYMNRTRGANGAMNTGSDQTDLPRDALMVAKIPLKRKNENDTPMLTKPVARPTQPVQTVSASEAEPQKANQHARAASGDESENRSALTEVCQKNTKDEVETEGGASGYHTKSAQESVDKRTGSAPGTQQDQEVQDGTGVNMASQTGKHPTSPADTASRDESGQTAPSDTSHTEISGKDTSSSDSDTEDEGWTIAKLENVIANLPEDEGQMVFKGHFEKMLELFRKFPTTLKRDDNGTYTDEFVSEVKKISSAYQELQIYPVKIMRDSRKEAGDVLADAGAISIICDVIVEELSADLKFESTPRGLFNDAIHVLWNFTDHNPKVTHAVRDHPHFLPSVLKKLKEWQKPHLNGTLTVEDNFVEGFLSIVHNIGLQDDNIKHLRQLHASDTVMPYLKSSSEEIKITATAFLANVATDKQAKFFSTSPDLLQFLLRRLESALAHHKHTSDGWRLTEIVRAVRQLARNDDNKRIVVEQGALPLLTEGLLSDLEGEKEACLDAIWVLSFNEDNASDILKNQQLLDLVVELYQESPECRRSAEGLLWQLRHELGETERYRPVVQEFLENPRQENSDPSRGTKDGRASADVSAGHVMLSYQWSHQPLVKEIYSRLKNHGLSVWMDIYEMGGSTRQSMAEAVENASVVLCCLSQKYKDSPNCRQELEYACDCDKTVIPLKLQPNYKPDGWLGFVVTGKLFYDFSGKYDFEVKFRELLNRIHKLSNKHDKDVPDGPVLQNHPSLATEMKTVTSTAANAVKVQQQSAPAVRMTPREMDKVKRWTQNDVKTWLQKFDLQGEKLEELTGEEVVFLHTLRAEAPEFFYRTLEKKLQVLSLQGLLQFKKALDNLMSVELHQK